MDDMWAPVLEKAWAKVKGSYFNADEGNSENAMRALIGVPVFGYGGIGTDTELDGAYGLLGAAASAGYIVGAAAVAGTAANHGTGTNECGLVKNHNYSILTTFTMNDAINVVLIDMIMLRDPTGTTEYSGAWNYQDVNWTPALLAQVPNGIDPETSNEDGIFVVPKEMLKTESDCLSSFAVAHYRAAEGYHSVWYDELASEDVEHSYYFTIPSDLDPMTVQYNANVVD